MRHFILIILCCICTSLSAQNLNIPAESLKDLTKQEAELKALADEGLKVRSAEEKLEKNYSFIPQLVKSLKTPYSFHYPYTSLEHISFIYSPDSSLRVFTWAMLIEDENEDEIIGIDPAVESDTLPSNRIDSKTKYKYFGGIQMNDKDLKLYPLIDVSHTIWFPEDTVVTDTSWFGAIYYNMVVNEDNQGKKFYTLLGWDGHSKVATRKIVDILYFEDGRPYFGAPKFEVVRDNLTQIKYRFVHEYRKGASVGVNYNDTSKIIQYDYIKPPTVESRGNYYMYIPDGTYQGLEWKNGMWTNVPKLYFEELSENDLAAQRAEQNEARAEKEKKLRKLKKKREKKLRKKKKKSKAKVSGASKYSIDQE